MKSHNPTLLLRLPLLVVLALPVLSPDSVWAQGETTSAIVGLVSDPTGAAIAGARVTITSTDNGLKRSVKTDDAGRFNFPQLKPGPYSVKAEANQFEAQENDSVLAGLGQKQTVEFTLKNRNSKPERNRDGRSAADQSSKPEYIHNPECARDRKPSERRR